MKRPALTSRRVAALKALAETVRPRLGYRAASLYGLGAARADIKAAVEFVDAIAEWHEKRQQPGGEG